MEVYADTNIFSKFHRIPTKSEEIFPINNVFGVRAAARPEIGKSPEWIPAIRCNANDLGNQPSQTGSTAVLLLASRSLKLPLNPSDSAGYPNR